MPNLTWFYNEFGLRSVYNTGLDAHLIIISRFSRMFAYGAVSLFIALFFSSLGFSDFRIGLFMTLTLAGDVIITTALTLVADTYGRRKTLLLGSCLMIASGACFAWAENYWVLLFAAVVGVISATGSDFGPFRAIEESILSHLTDLDTRSDVLSWYVTLASLGSALGTETSGRAVEGLQKWMGWDVVEAYHAVFGGYVIMGLINVICVLLLSKRTEAEVMEPKEDTEAEEVLLSDRRANSVEGITADIPITPPKISSSRFAQITPQTRSIMYKLWPLLIVDSLADGMVGYSLTTYYMDRQFRVSPSTLGDITSISYFLSAASTIFSGPLSNRLGLINTMVFTHLPSSAAVLLFPLAPNLPICIILFFIRTGLNNMDQAPRSAFIAAVVRPEERTAVMGITSVLRTLAATAGPSLTGWLAESDRFWIAFVAAGTLRIAYDVGLWALFVNMDIGREKTEER